MAAAVFLKGSLWFLAHMLVVHNDSQTSTIKKDNNRISEKSGNH